MHHTNTTMTNIFSFKPKLTNVFDHELILKNLLRFFAQVDVHKKITINVNEGIDIIEDGILDKVKYCVEIFDLDIDNIQFVGCKFGTKYNGKINYKFLPYFLDFEMKNVQVQSHNINYGWTRQKKVCMFFGRPQSSRLYLWEYTRSLSDFDCNLNADLNQSYIHSQCQNYFYDTDFSFKQLTHLLPNIDIPTPKITLPITAKEHDNFNFFNKVYKHYLFEIVDESKDSGHGYFVTEKTTRPFAMGRIPIINGKLGVMKFLNRIGFDTFKDVIEWEFYDNLQGLDRIQAIIQLAKDFDYENFDYDCMVKRFKHNTRHHANLVKKIKNKYFDQFNYYNKNSFEIPYE